MASVTLSRFKTMDDHNDWLSNIAHHPIFSLPKSVDALLTEPETSLELSTNTLPSFTTVSQTNDTRTPSGRRKTMILKDADLIVAVGREIRITSLGDTKYTRNAKQSFKTLHTPNIQFEIHQMVLNPSGKLLAIAGAFQVAVIVLPRPGFTRLVPETIDCKSVQVGQFYHASDNAVPIARIDWHPWGEAGSTLMVMTIDGKLREYDISMDTEEPQQVLSFVPERKSGSFIAEHDSEREVASFALGTGRADWGPLTVYVVMKSGDIYAMCPYMPQNASIPSSYIHALECFISAKQEYLAQGSSPEKDLSIVYNYQHRYVTALIKQLPPGTVFPAVSRSVPMHPPTTVRFRPARQGPFLLQPSPRNLEGSDGGDATDIAYLNFSADADVEDDGGETEHLGVVLLAFQDGKIDVCLDVDKVEARWDIKQSSDRDLPMLAVYETIDLGLVSMLKNADVSEDSSLLSLLEANHPVFLPDPIHEDTAYIYHAFGVHALQLSDVLQSMATALRTEDDAVDSSLEAALGMAMMSSVQPILTTFSVERRCSNPVVAVAIPNDVYLTYSIFILTSTMRITFFPLNLPSRLSASPPGHSVDTEPTSPAPSESKWLIPLEGPSAYVSLLANEPYRPTTVLSRPTGLPLNPRLSILPSPQAGSRYSEFTLTPDTLRYLGGVVAELSSQIHEVQLAQKAAEARSVLQRQELSRMITKSKELVVLVQQLRGPRRVDMEARFRRLQEEQKRLVGKMDGILQCLANKASPELSEHESKWFEELKRMKEEIMGSVKYDGDSLAARTRTLEREYARLMPALKELVEKERRRRQKQAANAQGLGISQAFEFGQKSNQEKLRISQVEKEISDLAAKLEISLTRHSSD